MCPLYKNAISKMQDNKGTNNRLSLEMVEFNPEWQFENHKTGEFYKNGVIPRKVFITYLGGNIQPASTDKVFASLENMFKSGALTNSEYIRIADYNKVISASFHTRVLYANTLNRLNEKYHCRPIVTFICGASLLSKTMLRLFASYVQQEFVFVATAHEAFDLINANNYYPSKEQDYQITISQKEIDQFAALCGNILFNETFSFDENKDGVSPDDPLYDLYTIIALLNHDLKELQKNEKEQKEEIEQALEHSRILNTKLSEEKKIVEEKEQIQQILIKKLNEAKIEAEIANRAKSEFLANISHEIITPLHAVIGMTELLCYTPLNSEQTNYTDTIQTSTQQLYQLLNNILDFSKNESGQIDNNTVLFDVKTLLNGILSRLNDSALGKKLRLSLTIPPAIPTYLFGYPDYLTQVLNNLVQNAIKFSNKGEIIVSIEPVSETPDNISLRFAISDTGIGIPEEKKELVFQKFTQLDSSATRKEGGTGLGLAITKQLVELMGGTLELSSRENEGSTFSFVLSFIKANENSKKNNDNSILPYTGSLHNNRLHSPMQSIDNTLPSITRILLVEDNAINQRVASAMLNKLGFTIDIADNGIEAIDALKQITYSLVIMDLQMPLMGGLEATKKIRKMETGTIDPDIPIIAMTANATQQDKMNCLNAGMNDFISKPVTIPALQELLNKWVELRK
ncbi:MAG: ATP-binding protein [Chlorobium sp.]